MGILTASVLQRVVVTVCHPHLAPAGCWDKVGQGGIIFLDVTVPTFSTYPEAINETNQTQMIQWPQIPVAILHKSTLTLDTTQSPSCFPQCYFFFQTLLVYREESTRMNAPRDTASIPCSMYQAQVLPGAPRREGALGGSEMVK